MRHRITINLYTICNKTQRIKLFNKDNGNPNYLDNILKIVFFLLRFFFVQMLLWLRVVFTINPIHPLKSVKYSYQQL